MELNKILSDGRWGDMAALVNANFEKIKVELMKLRFSSILTFCKGYFSTEARLVAKYPKGKTGEYAFVGTPWPGTVWEWIDTEWVDTGVAPQLGDSVFMELLKRHIDNKTILWDDTKKYIYSLGGGGGSTFAITVSMDASSIGKCKVEATGDVVSVVPSSDGGGCVVAGTLGGTVKVKMIPDTGYEIAAVKVDNESKGAVSEYVFNKLSANHSMSVRVSVIDEVATDFLVRSDLPGSYYSSTQDALDAVVAAYPDGLTRDVTISCVKGATEKRRWGTFVAELSNWNQDSMFTLTIDGADKLVYDGKSLGGLIFQNVDNIVLKNFRIRNFANLVEEYSPDNIDALLYKGRKSKYARNLYVYNCHFDGTSTVPTEMAKSSIRCMNAENVYINDCRLEKNYGNTFSFSDCSFVSLIKNTVGVEFSTDKVSHPSVLDISNAYEFNLEDNEISGNVRENYIGLVNVLRFFCRRNKFMNGGGSAIAMESQDGMQEVVIESNLFAGMLNEPIYSWTKQCVGLCKIDKLCVLNNTFYMSGNHYDQYTLRYGDIGTLDLYNNIMISLNTDKPVRGFWFNDVKTLNSGNNLYQFKATDGVSKDPMLIVINTKGVTDAVSIGASVGNRLNLLQDAGFEANSNLVPLGTPLLNIQSGGSDYRMKEGLPYYSDAGHLPAVDIDYRASVASPNTVGCYNSSGTAVAETGDATAGYTGVDYDRTAVFTNAAQYAAFADSVLVLKHKTLDRSRFVKYSIQGTQHKYLVLGRYGLINIMPELTASGEYQADELYTINIE